MPVPTRAIFLLAGAVWARSEAGRAEAARMPAEEARKFRRDISLAMEGSFLSRVQPLRRAV